MAQILIFWALVSPEYMVQTLWMHIWRHSVHAILR